MSSSEIRIELTEILQYLPHRYPFVMVDRIVELEPGKRIVGLKNVTFNEYYFQGHFPNVPVMPGVLILEALAQTGGVLAYDTERDMIGNKMVYLTGFDDVRFRKKVIPGDQLRLEVIAMKRKLLLWMLEGKAYVDGEVVAETKLKAVFM